MKKKDILALFDKQPLETARVSLQPMTEADFPEYLSHLTYAAAAAGSGIEESFKEKCRELLFDENTLMLAARRKENGAYIGYFELSALDTVLEIGIDLIKEYRQQGFGYEICRAVIDRIFSHFDLRMLRYCCFRSNVASLRLAKKLGAVQVNEVSLFEELQSDNMILVVHEIRRPTILI